MEPKHNSQMLGESNCYCAPVDGCDLNLSDTCTSKANDDTMGKHASLDCVRRELLSVREMEDKIWEEEATEDVVPETKMTGKRCRSSATTQVSETQRLGVLSQRKILALSPQLQTFDVQCVLVNSRCFCQLKGH